MTIKVIKPGIKYAGSLLSVNEILTLPDNFESAQVASGKAQYVAGDGFPVNSDGEVVVKQGNGIKSVYGYAGDGGFPSNSSRALVIAPFFKSLSMSEYGTQYKISDMTISSNTNGTNTVVDFPGLAGASALRIKPNSAAASVRLNFSSAVDLSLTNVVYIPIIPRDIGTGAGDVNGNRRAVQSAET